MKEEITMADLGNHIACPFCKEKDKQIKELEQKVQELQEVDNKRAFRLYCILYDMLEEQDPENVASRIDYLTGKDYSDICELYKTAKNLKQIDQLKQQLDKKDKEIKDLKEWQDWYSMCHKQFQKQIEDLTTELETYRPTKLHGNGQCECYKCKIECRQPIHWADWCSKYKGHIYCDDCLKEVLKEEQTSQTQLAIQELEKVKDRIKHFCNIHSDDYYGVKSQVKGVELDICEEIDNQINELKGEKK